MFPTHAIARCWFPWRAASLAAVCFAFSFAVTPPACADTLLDFEDLPRNTLVTNQYESRGVRFVHEGADVAFQGKIADFTLGDFDTANFGSSPNQAMTIGGAGGRTTAVFVNPMTLTPQSTDYFSVRVGDGDALSESFRVSAFSSQGASLHEQDYTTGEGAEAGGVTVSLLASDIARVEFTHLPSTSGFNIDDFAFNAMPVYPVQWPVSEGGNDHWYAQIVPPGGISWHDAKTEAENRLFMGERGHLATITSAEEDAFIQRTFDTHISWIGLTDERQQGTFEWITGEPVTYTRWWSGEPMNHPGEDYVQVEQGNWNDQYDVALPPTEYATQKYLIEWSTEPRTNSPTVTGVHVGGLTWNAAGYSIPLGTFEQSSPLPFTRINQVSLTFDEDVTFSDEQATLTDSVGNEYTLFGPLVSPGTEPGTYTATWQTESFLDLGRYTLRLGDGVVDDEGNQLDGEWTDNESTSSGDGLPGGVFVFTFNVLPGDVDQDGIVTLFDLLAVRNAQGTSPGIAGYNPLYDIDSNGVIVLDDVLKAGGRLFDVLPLEAATSAAAVPEPPTEYVAVLGVFVGLCLAALRRRAHHRQNDALRHRLPYAGA